MRSARREAARSRSSFVSLRLPGYRRALGLIRRLNRHPEATANSAFPPGKCARSSSRTARRCEVGPDGSTGRLRFGGWTGPRKGPRARHLFLEMSAFEFWTARGHAPLQRAVSALVSLHADRTPMEGDLPPLLAMQQTAPTGRAPPTLHRPIRSHARPDRSASARSASPPGRRS